MEEKELKYTAECTDCGMSVAPRTTLPLAKNEAMEHSYAHLGHEVVVINEEVNRVAMMIKTASGKAYLKHYKEEELESGETVKYQIFCKKCYKEKECQSAEEVKQEIRRHGHFDDIRVTVIVECSEGMMGLKETDKELQAANKAKEVRLKIGETIPEIAKILVEDDPAADDARMMVDAASHAVTMTVKMLLGLEEHYWKRIKERGNKK